MKSFPKKIAIIGVGLIGGSIALGLKKHFGSQITVFGSCNDPQRSKRAQKSGIIDGILHSKNLILNLTSVELIILATPIGEILNFLKILSTNKSQKTLIIDVGSTKEYILNQAKRILPANASFVGTHPMAGSEMSGFENSSHNLFRNKPWIVTEGINADENSLGIVKKLVDILGAKFIHLESALHDKLIVGASHLSLIASSILVNNIAGLQNWKKIAQIASTGFRDTTRLASDNPRMKTDIIMTNRGNILHELSMLDREISNFVKLLKQNDEKGVLKYFTKAKDIRDDWMVDYFS